MATSAAQVSLQRVVLEALQPVVQRAVRWRQRGSRRAASVAL